MKKHCLGDNPPYDIDTKTLDVGFVEFLMVESMEDPRVCLFLLPFSLPGKIYRAAKNAYFHAKQIPHTHLTMSDYRGS